MNTDKMTVGEFLELLKDIDKNLEIHIVGCCGSCWGVPSVQVQDYKNINDPDNGSTRYVLIHQKDTKPN